MGALSNARATADLFRRFVPVTRFGAKGDGVTDDTAAIQLAIDSLGAGGGRLYFPRGEYLVKQQGASGYCLRVIYPIHMVGEGANTTAIVPHASVPNSCDILQFEPSVAIDTHFTAVEDLFFGKPGTASRPGRHAIYVKTLGDANPAAVQYIAQFNLTRCYLQQSVTTGRGFFHDNDNVRNKQGGMAVAVIEKNSIFGGVFLNGSGDSIRIRENVISGKNVGIYAALINAADGPGSLLSIVDNNITSDGGAILLLSAPRTHISRNNIENRASGAAAQNGAAVIWVSGASAVVAAGVIEQNLISAFDGDGAGGDPGSDATAMIRVGNANGLAIRNNTLGTGSAGMKGVKIDASGGPTNLIIGPNTFVTGFPEADKIDGRDNGNGTIGVKQTPTLANSWVATGENRAYFAKGEDGYVDLNLTVQNGTAGTVCNLPPGFRPAAGVVERFVADAIEGGGLFQTLIVIDEAGTVTTSDPTKNDLLIINARFRAGGGADGVF